MVNVKELKIEGGLNLEGELEKELIILECDLEKKLEKVVFEGLTSKEKDIIARENEKLLYYMVEKFSNSCMSKDEIYSITLVGFTKALNTFSKNKNTKFSTYAVNCLRNEILFQLRKENKNATMSVSLNLPLSMDKNGNNLELGDTLSSTLVDSKSLEDRVIEDEEKKMLMDIIKILDPKEQFIIIYRYGLNDSKPWTQKEISEKINMSQANVSKIEKNCLTKMRQALLNRLKY